MMRINANGQFFQKAHLKASFVYNIQDMNGGYLACGELSELDLTEINRYHYDAVP